MDEESENIGGAASEDIDTWTSVVGHFFRGQMDRVIEWRSRLDQTTNWAVTIMAAILTFVFSSEDNPHYLLLIGMITVCLFLVIDARRYRAYDVWRSRIRLLEQDLFAPVFDPESEIEHDGWRNELAGDLRRPAYKTPTFEAIGRRLRRIYLPLLLVLLGAWLARVTVFETGESVWETAGILAVPGWIVLVAVAVGFAIAFAVAFWPRERQAKGELYEREQEGAWKDHPDEE